MDFRRQAGPVRFIMLMRFHIVHIVLFAVPEAEFCTLDFPGKITGGGVHPTAELYLRRHMLRPFRQLQKSELAGIPCKILTSQTGHSYGIGHVYEIFNQSGKSLLVAGFHVFLQKLYIGCIHYQQINPARL